jgi:hypothetical protein
MKSRSGVFQKISIYYAGLSNFMSKIKTIIVAPFSGIEFERIARFTYGQHRTILGNLFRSVDQFFQATLWQIHIVFCLVQQPGYRDFDLVNREMKTCFVSNRDRIL